MVNAACDGRHNQPAKTVVTMPHEHEGTTAALSAGGGGTATLTLPSPVFGNDQ